MFIRPLDRRTVEEIANEFAAFKNIGDIKFEAKDAVKLGCFSAQVNDANATLCVLQYGFCVVVAPGVTLPPTKLTPDREYLVNLIEVTLDIDIISVWEADSSTGLAYEIARYAFDKINTTGTRTSCTFPILIPRINNDRKNIIGVGIRKVGTEIKFEFKRDGRNAPVLN